MSANAAAIVLVAALVVPTFVRRLRMFRARHDQRVDERAEVYLDLRYRGYDLVAWKTCRERGPMVLDTAWNHVLERLEQEPDEPINDRQEV